jgi:hypothetical protein
MTLGYILYQNRHQKVRMNPTLNAIGWIFSLTVFATITMGSQIMFSPPHVNNTSLLANAFYLAFYRNGWAVAMAWMIFACHNGTGGIIRWFLQLPQWQPLGKKNEFCTMKLLLSIYNFSKNGFKFVLTQLHISTLYGNECQATILLRRDEYFPRILG